MCKSSVHYVHCVHYVEYNPTKKVFHVDTLKYNKRFVLDISYPEGCTISVPKNPEATFEYGILTCKYDTQLFTF